MKKMSSSKKVEQFKTEICGIIDLNFRSLEEIWSAVGYNDEEQDAQIMRLREQISDVLARHTTCQNELKHQMQDQITKTVKEIKDFRKRLRYSIEDQQAVKEPEEGPLVAKLDLLMKDADEVRQKVEYRGTVLEQCREQIAYLQQQLGRDLEIEFIDTRKDMSEERVEKFQLRVKELEAELATKREEAKVILGEFSNLLEELGYTPQTMPNPLDKEVFHWQERQTAGEPPSRLGDGLDRQQSTVSERSSSGSEGSGGGSRKRERNSDRPKSWSPPAQPRPHLPPPYPVPSKSAPSSPSPKEDFPFDISPEGMSRIMERVKSLQKEKEERVNYSKQLEKEIWVLWERLQVPESEREAFCTEVHDMGLTLKAVEKAEHELASLRLLKKEMMGSIIEGLREEIRMLWMEMSTSEEEQQTFTPMGVPDAEFDDEVLLQHEAEIQRLQEQLEEMRPLLKRIMMREDLLLERVKLAEIQKDPSRLSSRDPNAMRKRQDEMAMERRVARLPKLTETLRKKLEEWEKTNGPFLVDGVDYRKKLEESEREWAARKEATKERKEAQRRQDRNHRAMFGTATAPTATTPARHPAKPKKRASNPSQIQSKSQKQIIENNNALNQTY